MSDKHRRLEIKKNLVKKSVFPYGKRGQEYFYAKLNPGGVVCCWLRPFQRCLGVTAKVGATKCDTGNVRRHKLSTTLAKTLKCRICTRITELTKRRNGNSLPLSPRSRDS